MAIPQLSLLGEPNTCEERFLEFHQENPHVYDRLVAMCRRLTAKGHKKIGIAMLFEVMRWDHMLATSDEPYKLNNNYKAYYARMIMASEADLAGVFNTRNSEAD